jgi:thiol:disulfide interchange protein DsbD
METNVFPLAPVQNKFEQMELVRLYTDDGTDGPANQKFQYQLTGTVALPTYAIVNPFSGKIIAQLVGYSQKEDFNNFLDKGLARFDQQNEALSTVGKFNYP